MRDLSRYKPTKQLSICPRCKKRVLNHDSYGESQIYRSQHRLCLPCWEDEDYEIERMETNNLPVRLATYGPPNDWDESAA